MPSATASWGSQLDLALDPPTGDEVLELDCMEDNDVASNLLVSQAVAPAALSADVGSGTPAPPPPTLDMLGVCKCAAARLDVLWPAAVAETTRFC